MDKYKVEKDLRSLAEASRVLYPGELPQIPQDYSWNENAYIHKTLEEGTEVLSGYIKEAYNIKKIDTEIQDGQHLKVYTAKAPRLPNADATNGGPMYMTVGEQISINKTVYKEVTDQATGHVSVQPVI